MVARSGVGVAEGGGILVLFRGDTGGGAGKGGETQWVERGRCGLWGG